MCCLHSVGCTRWLPCQMQKRCQGDGTDMDRGTLTSCCTNVALLCCAWIFEWVAHFQQLRSRRAWPAVAQDCASRVWLRGLLQVLITQAEVPAPHHPPRQMLLQLWIFRLSFLLRTLYVQQDEASQAMASAAPALQHCRAVPAGPQDPPEQI